MRVAYERQMSEAEVLQLPQDEFLRWAAFFRLMDEEEHDRNKRMFGGGGTKRPRRGRR